MTTILGQKLNFTMPSVFQVNDLNGKEAVHIICSLECDEEDDLLLALTRAFLSQQLHRGDMYYLW